MMNRAAFASFGLLVACSQLNCSATTPANASPPSASSAAATTTNAQSSEATIAPLIGTTPPEWQPDLWIHSEPRTLASLRGKVVLVRWWTAGCPYCSASAPALRHFDQEYGARGLTVVGMYHHKEEGAFDPAIYRDTATKYGFTFPLAYDPDMKTLKSWLHGVDTGWTSITFVLDRKGVVRHVHPGGKYVEGDADYAKMQAVIESLLHEG